MDRFHWSDPPVQSAFPIAKPGYPFIFASAFVTAVFALIGFAVLTLISLLATLFICYFFRDPDRVTPDGENVIVSPADGRVVHASEVKSNPFIDGPCIQVGIFMNLFNVHVNRIPCAGEIEQIRYTPGRFYAADKDAASTHNEHNALILKTPRDHVVGVVQIAGLVARRILCWAQNGEDLRAGQRFGMICFGSRVDLYLPVGTSLSVSVGDRVKAGTSIIGHFE